MAQTAAARGIQVGFLAASMPSALEERLRSEGFELLRIPHEPGGQPDATATRRAADDLGAAWIWADGYRFGSEWQQEVKKGRSSLLLMDDNGENSEYFADLVLNQNPHGDPSMYLERSESTRLLLGTRYLLLRREFLDLGKPPRSTRATARRLLVSMGGSDPTGTTAVAMEALRLLPRGAFESRIIVGGGNPRKDDLMDQARALAGEMTVLSSVTDMPGMMQWADMALSAAGSTTWELLFMGVPCLLLSLAENQKQVGLPLSRAGVAVDLGWHGDLTPEKLARELASLADDQPRRSALTAAAEDYVDGKGAQRVLEAMGLLAD